MIYPSLNDPKTYPLSLTKTPSLVAILVPDLFLIIGVVATTVGKGATTLL